jgi:hypothetical protein
MTSPAQPVQREAVSPLELFFDLVFVFAVSQLSHHLLDHLSWRGAAETLVLLIAVFSIWSGTSFEATLLNIGRSHARWLLLAVMLAGLFMNAAIQDSFDAGGWAFAVPLLAIQAGRSILMIVTAPTRMLRSPRSAVLLGRVGYRLRLTSHTAAWRGEVNRSRCAWASSGRANNSAISACRAACVLATQPTGWWGAHQRHGGSVEVCAPSGRRVNQSRAERARTRRCTTQRG